MDSGTTEKDKLSLLNMGHESVLFECTQWKH